MTDIRSFFGRSTIVKSSSPLNSKEKKVIKIDWRKLNVFCFFFHFRLASLPRVALQRECQISLKRTKIHCKKCNLEFRKGWIKDCEWSKIPENCKIKECDWWRWFRKCRIKECEFWIKFAFFNSAFFCSPGLFFALLSSLKASFCKKKKILKKDGKTKQSQLHHDWTSFPRHNFSELRRVSCLPFFKPPLF